MQQFSPQWEKCKINAGSQLESENWDGYYFPFVDYCKMSCSTEEREVLVVNTQTEGEKR